jgi:oligopeptidase B
VRGNVNLDFDTEIFRFSYTSLTTPNSIFDFNLNTKERTLLKEEEVLDGFDKNNYETKRIYATAGDGTQIPMSLVYRKGCRKTATTRR